MPDQAIDYAALAQQAGAVTPPAAGVDYAALAKQAGAVASAPAPPSPGTWEDRGIGGKVWHPASGVTERDRADNAFLGMPPEFAALSGLAIGRAVGAPALSVAARAVAGLKATAGEALPQVKYQVTRSTLETMGVPPTLSIPIAMYVSGLKGGKKATAGEPSTVPPPIVETAQQTMARKMASAPAAVPEPPAPASAAAPAAPVSSEPPVPAPTEFQAAQSARANALPDQKALNEAALAARRAAYQASQSPAAETVVPASGKLHFTAPEWAAFRELRARGASLEDAASGARAAGAFARQFGLSQPTLEQTRFPKAQ